MNDLIDLLISQEMIVVLIVIGVACLLYYLISLIDKNYYKRLQHQNTIELNKLVDEYETEEVKDPSYNIPVITNIEPVEDALELDEIKPTEEVKEEVEEIAPVVEEIEELTYADPEPNIEEAKEELRRLTEELEKATEEENQNIALTSYEEDQERNAIISLDELLERTKQMEIIDDEGDEPISLADLESKFKAEVEPITIEPELKAVQEQLVFDEAPKFKASPIISPIYGIKKDISQDLELENTANFEKFDEEIRKTNEFLDTLKELEKNLN